MGPGAGLYHKRGEQVKGKGGLSKTLVTIQLPPLKKGGRGGFKLAIKQIPLKSPFAKGGLLDKGMLFCADIGG